MLSGFAPFETASTDTMVGALRQLIELRVRLVSFDRPSYPEHGAFVEQSGRKRRE
jgi:hypothetical protein